MHNISHYMHILVTVQTHKWRWQSKQQMDKGGERNLAEV